MKPKFSKLIKKYPKLNRRRSEEEDGSYRVVTEVRRSGRYEDDEE